MIRGAARKGYLGSPRLLLRLAGRARRSLGRADVVTAAPTAEAHDDLELRRRWRGGGACLRSLRLSPGQVHDRRGGDHLAALHG